MKNDIPTFVIYHNRSARIGRFIQRHHNKISLAIVLLVFVPILCVMFGVPHPVSMD